MVLGRPEYCIVIFYFPYGVSLFKWPPLKFQNDSLMFVLTCCLQNDSVLIKILMMRDHALSPPPSHHHLYIIHLINWLQRFYRITTSLKRPFVPKSDVKQRFTTTTTQWWERDGYCAASSTNSSPPPPVNSWLLQPHVEMCHRGTKWWKSGNLICRTSD